MTSTINELGLRGPPAPSRLGNESVFLRAKRHSRSVRRLRVAIPVLVVVVFAGIMLASWLDPIRILARLPTQSGRLVISGSKITMESPKLSGFTKDSRPYEVNARAAAQDITKPDFVELSDVRAKIENTNKEPINLTAVDGLYNRKSGILRLWRDVILTTPGYQMNLAEATIDTVSSHVVSNHPVQVKMLQGTLVSDRLEVTGGGEVVVFDGNVKLVLDNLPDPNAKAVVR